MIIEQYLQNIGLSDKEAKVYLAGLQLGPASIQDLAKTSNIKRSTVYEVIEDLKEKSLVNISQRDKRKVFVMQEPDNLLLFLKQKENILNQIMPDLEAIKNSSATKPAIRVFDGPNGLKQIYEDMIKKPGEILAMAAPKDKISLTIWDYLVNHWESRRIKSGIKMRRININFKKDPVLNHKKIDRSEELEQVVYWPEENYPFSIGIYVYRQKVAFVSFAEQEMVGIVIRSKEINATLKMMFEMFWQK